MIFNRNAFAGNDKSKHCVAILKKAERENLRYFPVSFVKIDSRHSNALEFRLRTKEKKKKKKEQDNLTLIQVYNPKT